MPVRIYPLNFIIIGLILLPNLLLIIFPPVNIPLEKESPAGWTIIMILERVGQVAAFLLPLFWKVKASGTTKTVALVMMIISLGIYYTGWIRFFSGGREFRMLYEPLLTLPVPMAISPVIYFLFTGLLLKSWPVSLAAVVLAAGHIPESLRHICVK